MSRPKQKGNFRLYRRNLDGRKFFYVRFLDEAGKIITSRSTGTTDERQAVIRALELAKEIPKTPLKSEPFFIPFLLDFWQRDSEYVRLRAIEGHILSNAHITKTAAYLKLLLSPYQPFKNLRIRQVTTRHLDSWKIHIASTDASRKGINHAISGIRVALRWAYRQGFISKNPAETLTNVAYQSKERGILSMDEIHRIENLDWSDLRQKAAIVLGYSCGLRRGEIRALCWRHVDFDKKLIRVSENYTDEDGLKEPKAGSYRTVPFWGKTEEILIDLSHTNPYGGNPEDFVLPNTEQDKPIAAVTLKRGFEGIMDAIGINAADRKNRRLSFHGMRHTYVTTLREAGIPAFIASRLSGHRTVSMFENYSHQSQSSIDSVRLPLEKIFMNVQENSQ